MPLLYAVTGRCVVAVRCSIAISILTLLTAELSSPAYSQTYNELYASNAVVVTATVDKSRLLNEDSPPGNYICTHNDLIRKIDVIYTSQYAVPCDVTYKKISEEPGSEKVLWSASNLVGYCEQKATDFTEKLRTWGWDCKEYMSDT